MTLIAHDPGLGARVVTDDPWRSLADDSPVPESGDVVVSLGRLERAESFPGRVGVAVAGAERLEVLVPYLPRLSLIAIEVPKFTDGRAYSLARLLRDRHGYEGHLRAVGDVLRDQLFFFWRCGFNSFQLPVGKDPSDAIAAFDDFERTYQPATDHDRPSWQRFRS